MHVKMHGKHPIQMDIYIQFSINVNHQEYAASRFRL